jgi:hypothetical protein
MKHITTVSRVAPAQFLNLRTSFAIKALNAIIARIFGLPRL